MTRLVIAGLAAAILGLSSNAYACSCNKSKSVKESLDFAKAVFLGKVLKVEQGTERVGDFDASIYNVTMTVRSGWKGKYKSGEVRLRTGMGGGDCGYHFEVGRSYLVYANGLSEDNLHTSICSRTVESSKAGDDIVELGYPLGEGASVNQKEK